MKSMPECLQKKPSGVFIFMLFFFAALCAAPAAGAAAEDGAKVDQGQAAVAPLTAESLWAEATAAEKQEDWAAASGLFERIHKDFPDSPKAEEALWRAARLAKQQASLSAKPDWENVRDLFRLFAASYPDSPHSAEAYFEIGMAQYHMRFFREALTYFKLFRERYPQSPRIPTARYWEAKALMETGKLDRAIAIFKEVAQSKERDLKIKGLIGLGEAHGARKEYRQSLRAFERVMAKFPRYYFDDLDFLIDLGTAYFRVGQEKKGRKQLFYYLNLDPQSPRKAEVLFALGESFYRQGDDATAQKLYAKVLETGKPDERAVVLARFRQAQYLDDPRKKLSRWQKRGDLTDPAGDLPYLAVLDSYRNEPIAQDARYGLFLRYKARGDFEFANEMGRSYLRYATPGLVPEKEVDAGCGILTYLAGELLERQAYQKVYELYQTEYPHVAACPRGRLRYLIGQALEALSLYRQAAVVYYRALALPLTEKEKIDLYYRRADVYLILKDLKSAGRLLKYLRKNYAGQKAEGEIDYYSGRLREEQGRYGEALAFYDQAAEILTFPEKKSIYGQARLRMLLAGKRFQEALVSLAQYRKDGWLSSELAQEWYGRVGDALRLRHRDDMALKAYHAAVGDNMPQEGEVAQGIHLHLGELLVRLGEVEKGRAQLRKAQGGSDPFLKKIAEERLNQADIDQALSGMKTLLGNS